MAWSNYKRKKKTLTQRVADLEKTVKPKSRIRTTSIKSRSFRPKTAQRTSSGGNYSFYCDGQWISFKASNFDSALDRLYTETGYRSYDVKRYKVNGVSKSF